MDPLSFGYALAHVYVLRDLRIRIHLQNIASHVVLNISMAIKTKHFYIYSDIILYLEYLKVIVQNNMVVLKNYLSNKT